MAEQRLRDTTQNTYGMLERLCVCQHGRVTEHTTKEDGESFGGKCVVCDCQEYKEMQEIEYSVLKDGTGVFEGEVIALEVEATCLRCLSIYSYDCPCGEAHESPFKKQLPLETLGYDWTMKAHMALMVIQGHSVFIRTDEEDTPSGFLISLHIGQEYANLHQENVLCGKPWTES